MCLGVVLFASILFGTLCTSWTYIFISFIKLGKFSFIIFSNKFSISCSFSSLWHPYDSNVGTIKVVPEVPYPILIFLDSFSSCCSDWIFFLPDVPNHWFHSWLHRLHSKFFFISISVSSVSNWIFLMLLTSSLSFLSILKLVFWTLHLIDCLSPFRFILFLEVWSVHSFGPYFFVSSFWQPPCVCFYVLGGAALTYFLSSMA